MKKCLECLAHYSDDVKHICPPWLKELARKKAQKEYEDLVAEDRKAIDKFFNS